MGRSIEMLAGGSILTPKDTGAAAEYVPTGRLKTWANNPRKNDAAVASVAKSIERFGFGAPLLARRETGEIIAGHTRLKAALQLKLDRVPVRYLDLSADEAHALALADNRLGEIAEWDDDLLAGVLQGLDANGVEIGDLGFDDDELKGLLNELPIGGDVDEELGLSAPEQLQEKWKTASGQLWKITGKAGEHFILCGDAFDVRARDRLLLGADISVVYTDPPYGMSLDVDHDAKFSSDKNHRKTGARFSAVIGDDQPFDPSPLFSALDVKEQFWWGADYYRRHLPDGGSWVVWDKRGNDSGMDLDVVAGSCFELCWSRQKHKRDIARILWSGHHGMQREDTKSRLHPTQKPVALAVWFLEKWAPEKGAVLDAFLGSGSTLLACERLGRACYGMELSPAYVAVCLERMTANGCDASLCD